MDMFGKSQQPTLIIMDTSNQFPLINKKKKALYGTTKHCHSILSYVGIACLTPFTAESILAQTILPIVTNTDNQSISIAAGETINANAQIGVSLINPGSSLDNQGLISNINGTSAVSVDADNVLINNQAGGVIQSDSRALEIDGEGLVVNNSDSILGTGDQRNGTVYADSTASNFTLNNQASGVIDAGAGNQGAGFSAETSQAAQAYTINNEGDIIGRGNAGAGLATAGDGIRLERTRVAGALDGSTTGLFTGSITNSGNITSEGANGTVSGLRVVNGVSFQGTIDNEVGGLISGTQNGLYFGNAVPSGGSDHTGGIVNNAGTISSDSRALNIDGEGLVVNNSGSILGTGDQRNGTVYFDGTSNNAIFNNTQTGVVDSLAGTSASGVSIQSGAGNRTNSVVNNGLIQGRGAALASGETAGVRVFGPSSSLADVDITNGPTGRIASETSAGVLIEGVTYTGSIQNSGTIQGSSAAIDTRTALGDITIDQLSGSLIGGVLTGAGDDTLNITGDSTVTGPVDLGAGNNTTQINSGATLQLDTTSLQSNLNVDGSLALNLGSTLQVSGTAVFNTGSELILENQVDPSIALAPPIIVIEAGGVAIPDSNIGITDNSLLTDFVLSSTANTIQVQAEITDLSTILSDDNVISLGAALQGSLSAATLPLEFSSVFSALDTLGSTEEFEAAAAELLPDLSVGITRELHENQSHIYNAIERRLFRPSVNASGAWFETFGGSTNGDSGSNVTDTSYDADTYGFIVGYDKVLTDSWNIGAAFAYSDINVDAGSNSTDVDAYSFNAYAGYQANQQFFHGALSYTSGDVDSSRSSLAGNIGSDSDIDQFSALLTAGLVQEYRQIKIKPFVSLQYSHISQSSFTEDGGFDFNLSADDFNTLELGVGVELFTGFTVKNMPSFFRSQIVYYNDVISDERSFDAQFAGGDSFGLEGDNISSSTFELELEAGIEITQNQSISIGCEGNYNSDVTNNTGFLRYSIQF